MDCLLVWREKERDSGREMICVIYMMRRWVSLESTIKWTRTWTRLRGKHMLGGSGLGLVHQQAVQRRDSIVPLAEEAKQSAALKQAGDMLSGQGVCG